MRAIVLDMGRLARTCSSVMKSMIHRVAGFDSTTPQPGPVEVTSGPGRDRRERFYFTKMVVPVGLVLEPTVTVTGTAPAVVVDGRIASTRRTPDTNPGAESAYTTGALLPFTFMVTVATGAFRKS